MTGNEMSLIQWALQQGGITVVCLVVLFFYRRDWHTTVDQWKEQHEITVSLVERSIEASVRATAALSENTVVIHSLKRAVEASYMGRRSADQFIVNDKVNGPS